jgi:hypothetical protein
MIIPVLLNPNFKELNRILIILLENKLYQEILVKIQIKNCFKDLKKKLLGKIKRTLLVPINNIILKDKIIVEISLN